METYPNLGQAISSSFTSNSGRVLDRASNGIIRARSYYTENKKTFTVVHSAITSAQKSIIEDFYNANKDIAFLFISMLDNITYTCIFGEDSINFSIIGTGYWNAEVILEQV